jgi:endonuclease G
MNIDSIRARVEQTSARLTEDVVRELEQRVRGKKPRDLVDAEALKQRRRRLAEADFRPSPTDEERILGTNDLVDVNYLARAQIAAKAVCRIILRDRQGREIGYGSGFKVAPNVVMTNHHVLDSSERVASAVAEFGYELDVTGRPAPTTRFLLDPEALYFSDAELDFAIAAISPRQFTGTVPLDAFGFLRMQSQTGKVTMGEFLTIIQHPAGQPKQIALRENQLLDIQEQVLWYQSDTAPGSSGSAVLNDSWQVVALHRSGVPRKDAEGHWLRRDGRRAGPDTDDGDIDWIANEGTRISRIISRIREAVAANALVRQLEQAIAGEIVPEALLASNTEAQELRTGSNASAALQQVKPIPGGARITVPFSFEVRLTDGTLLAAASASGHPSEPAPAPGTNGVSGDGAADGAAPNAAALAPNNGHGAASGTEAWKPPILDNAYADRKGYDPNFLGLRVALPKVTDTSRISRMDGGDFEIPYEHFTVVMDKTRRLALYAASNVDAAPGVRRPEPGRDYSRDGLGGFGKNDREQWVTDPRIPEQHQLPDEFYNKDRQAFDKGHLVRREDVCFGTSYRQIQRANGDTYHTTNCTPQVRDFNRSGDGGLWGRLENEVLKQAKTERYCLLAGPLLRKNDRFFEGVDRRGPVRVQIPSAFWKIVVARAGDELQAFAFLLDQDLGNVAWEFAVSAKWRREMISIAELERRMRVLKFAEELHHADQFGRRRGEEIARVTGFRAARERAELEDAPAATSNGGE